MSTCLVATDGSEHALIALEIASTLAKSTGSELVVVHVVSDKEPSAGIKQGVQQEFSEELEKRSASLTKVYGSVGQLPDAGVMVSHHSELSRLINTIYGENILRRAEHHLHDKGINGVTTLLLEGDPAEELIELALKRNVDMVVMGCRGLGRMKGLLFGSVSQRVAHELECRVVMVK